MIAVSFHHRYRVQKHNMIIYTGNGYKLNLRFK